MLAQRWNVKTKLYEEYELPEEAILYSDNMDVIVQCARCAEKLVYGSGYTSRQIHTNLGIGYSVCPKCHEKELKEEGLI